MNIWKAAINAKSTNIMVHYTKFFHAEVTVIHVNGQEVMGNTYIEHYLWVDGDWKQMPGAKYVTPYEAGLLNWRVLE